MRIRLVLFFAVVSIFAVTGQRNFNSGIYDATVSDWEILTPEAKKSPRLNGPEVYGARPGKQFIYRIPCEGERPIAFSVGNLPQSMVLDAQNGIISGRVPENTGSYVLNVKAENAFGESDRKFNLVVGQKLALTPPMGWNSWGGHMLLITDEIMRRAADIMVEKGLADVGFQYVSIDDCWMRIDPEEYQNNSAKYLRNAPGYPFEKVTGPVRDENGNFLPNSFFPDMKGMTDHIHSYGLKAGIYSGPGPLTCQWYSASYGYEGADAKTFADWGFDLLKYDMCSYLNIMTKLNKALADDTLPIKEITIWEPMTQHLANQDRDIQYNLCQYGRQDPWKWAPAINIQSWRIGGDLNHNVNTYFEQALRIVKDLREYSKPGQWNDPDFMYIGKIHNARKKMDPPHDIPLNTNQRYQYVSLWAMINAPFFFSANIDELDDFTVGLLRNADIVNVNQDALGHVAEVVREDDGHVILKKKMADGGLVIGIYNLNDTDKKQINIKWDELDLCCQLHVRDLWRQKDIGTIKNGLTVEVSPQGCAIFRLN